MGFNSGFKGLKKGITVSKCDKKCGCGKRKE